MRSRHLAALSLAAALLVTGTAATQSAAATTLPVTETQADPTDCPSEQYRPTPEDKKNFYCGFKELGPRNLPAGVAKLLKNYDRFGGLTPQQFLSWYRDGLDWKYPAEDGFRDVNGTIDRTTVEIPTGTKLDRFGLYYGRYLSKPGVLPRARAPAGQPQPGGRGGQGGRQLPLLRREAALQGRTGRHRLRLRPARQGPPAVPEREAEARRVRERRVQRQDPAGPEVPGGAARLRLPRLTRA